MSGSLDKKKACARDTRKSVDGFSASTMGRTMISTGPLAIPALSALISLVNSDLAQDVNFSVYIILSNPTGVPLSTTITIGETDVPLAINTNPSTPIPPVLVSRNITESETHVGLVSVDPRSTRMVSYLPSFPPQTGLLPNPATRIIRVTAVGDFAVDGNKVQCGKLQIQVLGAISQTSSTNTAFLTTGPPADGTNPLVYGDPIIEARFADFVVCTIDKTPEISSSCSSTTSSTSSQASESGPSTSGPRSGQSSVTIRCKQHKRHSKKRKEDSGFLLPGC